jgi:hypothetical protein
MIFRRISYFILIFLLLSCGSTKKPYAIYKDRDELLVIDDQPDPDLKKLRKLKEGGIDRTEFVAKNEFNSKAYGPKADNGVLFIYTVEYDNKRTLELKRTLDQIIKDYEASKEAYLFVLDGFVWKDIEHIKKIKQKDLSVVEKLPYQTAKIIYGDRAKENTVLVTTKRKK